jgi:uncharacterized membrane protein required for colicin V production
MKHEFFNVLDYFYIAVMFCSAAVGLYRGFVKDFFGNCAWFGSGFLAPFVAPYLVPFADEYISNPNIARGAAIVIAYLALLLVFLPIIGALSRNVKGSTLSGVDRAAGMLFGLLRGVGILVCICVSMLVFDFPKTKYAAVRKSKISSLIFKVSKAGIPEMKRLGVLSETSAEFLEKLKKRPKKKPRPTSSVLLRRLPDGKPSGKSSDRKVQEISAMKIRTPQVKKTRERRLRVVP